MSYDGRRLKSCEVDMREKRQHGRIDFEVEIRVNWMERGQEVTTTFNYSDGGILAKNPLPRYLKQVLP